MASLLAHLMNAVFRLMPITDDTQKERAQNASRRPPRAPKSISVEQETLGGVPCEIVKKVGNKGVVFYIHGGGFTTGSARERRALTFYLCDKTGYDVIACDYRLAPEYKLPAAFEDCFAAYAAASAKYGALVIAGESAGGISAVMTAQRAIVQGIYVPAVLAFSPAAGIGMQLPSHKNNVKTDYMIKRDPSSKQLLDKICPSGYTDEFLVSPQISPIYGSFEGFPPLFLACSDTEVFYDDAKLLYEKARAAGVKCMLRIEKGVPHAFVVMPWLKEAKRTFAVAQKFLQENIADRQI